MSALREMLHVNNLKQLEVHFKSFQAPRAGLNKTLFAACLESLFSDSSMRVLRELLLGLFEMFDVNRDGCVNFYEFRCGLAFLCGDSSSAIMHSWLRYPDEDIHLALCAQLRQALKLRHPLNSSCLGMNSVSLRDATLAMHATLASYGYAMSPASASTDYAQDGSGEEKRLESALLGVGTEISQKLRVIFFTSLYHH